MTAEYFAWLLIGWFALNLMGSVLLIGEKRNPMTPEKAVVSVLVYGMLIMGINQYLLKVIDAHQYLLSICS